MKGQFQTFNPPVPFQMKDLRARQVLGGFIPSCGVGTGFKREALESWRPRIRTAFSSRCA